MCPEMHLLHMSSTATSTVSPKTSLLKESPISLKLNCSSWLCYPCFSFHPTTYYIIPNKNNLEKNVYKNKQLKYEMMGQDFPDQSRQLSNIRVCLFSGDFFGLGFVRGNWRICLLVCGITFIWFWFHVWSRKRTHALMPLSRNCPITQHIVYTINY